MIVEIPLHWPPCPGAPDLGAVREALRAAYAGERFVETASDDVLQSTKVLEPEALNDTNRLQLFAFGDPAAGQARLVARLDNLGKGAAGAAVQNLNLVLGLDEGAGLA
jgi:N-acetyl-gamma-glutamyl-phosphate reductase